MTYALAAPLQAAVWERLTSDAGVTALAGGNVFDAPPPGRPPELYVALGPEEARDRSDKTARAAEHRFTVSVVSSAGGFHAAKELAGAVDAALAAAPLALGTGRVVHFAFERAQARRDRNGTRRRIDLRFRALVDAT